MARSWSSVSSIMGRPSQYVHPTRAGWRFQDVFEQPLRHLAQSVAEHPSGLVKRLALGQNPWKIQDVRPFTEPMAPVDRAVLDGDPDGFVKVHVRAGTDRIVGATVVARHAGEMISELTLAMVGGLGLRTLARTIHPYPTQAEAIKRVADAYNRTRLTPFVKGLFEKWLAWMR